MGAQAFRKHPEKTVCRGVLDGFIGGADLRVVVFDGGGQVAGDDLRRIVKERRRRDLAGIDLAAKVLPADEGQRVGRDRRVEAVLREIFLNAVAHEAPAGDVPHPGHHGKKAVFPHDLRPFRGPASIPA